MEDDESMDLVDELENSKSRKETDTDNITLEQLLKEIEE